MRMSINYEPQQTTVPLPTNKIISNASNSFCETFKHQLNPNYLQITERNKKNDSNVQRHSLIKGGRGNFRDLDLARRTPHAQNIPSITVELYGSCSTIITRVF